MHFYTPVFSMDMFNVCARACAYVRAYVCVCVCIMVRGSAEAVCCVLEQTFDPLSTGLSTVNAAISTRILFSQLAFKALFGHG